jgi:hypothetical protein
MVKESKQTYLVLFLLFIAIIPYCYLSFFTHPISDDFAFASLFRKQEYFDLLKGTYLNWNGRYASNIFIYLNPISFGSFTGYKFIPAATMILLIVAISFLTKEVFFHLPKTKQLIITLVLTIIFLHNIPIISEGIYWFTSAVTYQLGIIATVFYFALFINIILKKKKGLSVIFLSILLFFICGFNEGLTFLIVFILALISFVFYYKKLRGKKIIVTQFFLAVLFASFMIFAPGNEFRGETYQNAHNFPHSFIYSILQIGRFSFNWIVSIPLICSSLLYYDFNSKIREENIFFAISFHLNKWISLLILFVLIFICVFPPYWATGILGQHRTLNIAYFFFIIMWFINLTVWFNYFQNIKIWRPSNKINLSVKLLFISGILLTGNGYNALHDIISGSAKSYNIELSQRHQILNKAKESAQKKLVLPQIISKPKCLFVSDITEDPSYWTNQAYNTYFKLEDTEIMLKP